MNIGILHQYSLLSSGSGVYTVRIAQRLLERGHQVRIVCRDFQLHRQPLIDEAFLHDGQDMQRLFRRRREPVCTAHALRGEIMAIAYPRSETPNGQLFTALNDDEIREYVDYHVERVMSIVRQHRLQVLHANHVVLMPYIARQVKRRLGLPYLVAVHGSTIEYVVNQDERYRRYAVAGLRGADGVIALNWEVRDRVLSICPEIEPRLIDVPVGVDTAVFRPLHTRRLKDQPADNHNERPQHPQRTVAYVGTLSLDKGVHCLFAALPVIAAQVPDVHLLLLGTGAAREPLVKILMALDRGDLKAAARALDDAPVAPLEEPWLAPVKLFWEHVDQAAYLAAARAADLADQVTFAGYLSHEDIARVLPEADLLVIPSLVKEAFPLVSLEALACGVLPMGPYRGGLMPILDEIAAVVGPLADLIRLDPRPEAFVADLADRVPRALQYLAVPGVRERVGRQCRTLAVSRYDWDSVVDRLEQVYRDMLLVNAHE